MADDNVLSSTMRATGAGDAEIARRAAQELADHNNLHRKTPIGFIEWDPGVTSEALYHRPLPNPPFQRPA